LDLSKSGFRSNHLKVLDLSFFRRVRNSTFDVTATALIADPIRMHVFDEAILLNTVFFSEHACNLRLRTLRSRSCTWTLLQPFSVRYIG
jgi:hypothetical protein